MPINGISSMTRNWGALATGTRGPGSNMPINMSRQTSDMMTRIVLDAATFVHQGSLRASQLRQTLGGMSDIFDRLTAVSENSEVFEVTKFSGRSIPEINVSVAQLATTQANEGTALRANDRVITAGTYSFELNVNGKTTLITFTTNETLTNREFQQRMATAVNAAEIGVNANVATANNNSTLTLTSTASGKAKNGIHFTIRDTVGNAVELTGVDKMTREAVNALFTVNGEEREHTSNEIDLGDGTTITLRGVSEEAVGVKEGRDAIGARAATRNFVSQFNALLSAAQANSGDIRTRALARELNSIIRRSRRELSDIGIDTAQNGQLTINEDRFRTAAENGAVQRFFGNGDRNSSGFNRTLTRIADSVATSPTRHISPHATRLPGFNAALNMVSGGNQSNQNNQQNSQFDVYFMQEALGGLLNVLK